MKKNRMVLLRERIFILALVICCGAFVMATTWSSAKSTQTEPQLLDNIKINELRKSFKVENIKITNKVKSISVVGIEKDPTNVNIVLSLRNDSDKRMTAYMVSAGNTVIGSDYAFSEFEDGIASGDILKVYHGIDASMLRDKSVHIAPDLRKKGISVLAVIFEDGTTEGDSARVENLTQYRLGGKTQVEEILFNLEAVRESSKSEQLTKYEQLKSSLRDSSKHQEMTRSYFRFGKKDVQDTFLMEVGSSRNNASKELKNRVADLIERYKRINSKCILQ